MSQKIWNEEKRCYTHEIGEDGRVWDIEKREYTYEIGTDGRIWDREKNAYTYEIQPDGRVWDRENRRYSNNIEHLLTTFQHKNVDVDERGRVWDYEKEKYTHEIEKDGRVWDKEKGEHTHQAENKKSGGCFITTACVITKGLPDNCEQLTTLRLFRDTYVSSLPQGEELIAEYYAIAPRIVSVINDKKNSAAIWNDLYETLVLKSLSLIQYGKYDEAYQNYLSIVNELKCSYL